MSLTEIKERVQAIQECAGDYEIAHSKEDALYQDFIEFVATSKDLDIAEVQEKAAEVLKTKQIEFIRYCA